MKVLLLSHGFQAEYEAGIANGLAANGIDVTLVGCDGTMLGRLDPRIEVVNLRGSQDVRRSRAAKVGNVLRYMVRYLWLVATKRHEVVHNIGIHTTEHVWISVIEALLIRLFARRFIVNVHNVLPHGRHTRTNRWIYRLIYAMPHFMVVHTERTRQILINDFGASPTGVLAMEHGIDRFPPFDEVARNQVRAELGLKPSDRLVLSFGHLAMYKGPDVLIAAMSQLSLTDGWHLLFAGRCPHAHVRIGIKELIDKSTAKERIHWWERYISDDEVAPLFFAADVLALPYRHIDQSGVLFVALATGLPVVATDVGSFRHYVNNHAGVIVPPGDVVGLAQGLRDARVPLESDRRRELAKRAQAFDWRVTVRPVLCAYGRGFVGTARSTTESTGNEVKGG